MYFFNQKKCEIIVKGNCDEIFSKNYTEEEMKNDPKPEGIIWNQSMMTKEDMEKS